MENQSVITNHYFFLTKKYDNIKVPDVVYPIGKIINGRKNISISSELKCRNKYDTSEPYIQLVANFVEINNKYYSVSNNISTDRSYVDYILYNINVMKNFYSFTNTIHLIIESKDIISHTKFYDIIQKMPIIEKNGIYKISASQISFDEFIKQIEIISYNQINSPNIYKIYKNIELDPIITKKYDEIGLDIMLNHHYLHNSTSRLFLFELWTYEYILKSIELLIIILHRLCNKTDDELKSISYIEMTVLNKFKNIPPSISYDLHLHCYNIIDVMCYSIYLLFKYKQENRNYNYDVEQIKNNANAIMNITQKHLDSIKTTTHYTQIEKIGHNEQGCYTLNELARCISGIDLINDYNNNAIRYFKSYNEMLYSLVRKISTRYPHF